MRTPAQDMEGSSIVSRARTAFHSAAAKAERVFTDRKKSDPLTDRDSDIQPPKNANDDSSKFESKGELKYLTKKPAPLKTKQDWQEKLKNIRFGKKGAEDFESPGNSAMSFAIFDENLYLMGMKNAYESKDSEASSLPEESSYDIIPPASILKQLAIAVEAGKKFKSMRDILASSRDSSPVRERAFSAVKSLVLREKEDKFTSELGGDDDVCSLMNSLLETEGQFPGMKISSGSDTPTNMSILPKDIHGAPPQSFVVKLAEVMGSFKTLRKMAIFWYKVVTQLRRFWLEERYIPGIPPDDGPDLNSCLLYQQLQVINCCISRKKRHSAATESVESAIRQSSSNDEESRGSEGSVPQTLLLYARISTGELVLRLGADKQSENLTMLETGEPVFSPVMQEGPLLTEDLIKETEEFVLRTGSVGAGCSQLLSDMQAFKAANPGCILEDFVRWHSPPDWTEGELKEEQTFTDGELSSAKGQLSSRMQKEGNLWRELWETAKPVPAVNQTPLFDEDLAVEGILSDFENVVPSELLEHLLISLLGSGFTLAEEKLSANESLSKLFYECKDYVVATCQSCIWMEKVEDICQVYETVHMMLHKPEEVLKIMKQPDDAAVASEPKSRFKRLSIIFGSKDHSNGKQSGKEQKSSGDNPRQTFSSIFSKKPPRPDAPSPLEKPVSSSENDWTIV